MKKVKILLPIAMVCSASTPLVGAISCSCGNNEPTPPQPTPDENDIKYDGEYIKKVNKAENSLTFKLDRKLSEGEVITPTFKIIEQSRWGMSIRINQITTNTENFVLNFEIVNVGSKLANYDAVAFDLTFKSTAGDVTIFDKTFEHFKFVYIADESEKSIPIEKLVIQNGVLVGIDATASELEGFNTLKIPNNVVEISSNIFESFEKNNEIPTNIKTLDFEEGEYPLYIKYRAFQDCINFEHIILPERLQYVDSEAFSGCSNVKCLDLTNWSNEKLDGISPFVESNIFDGWNSTGSVLTMTILSSSTYYMLVGSGLSDKWFYYNYQELADENFKYTTISETNEKILTGLNKKVSAYGATITIPADVTCIGPRAFAGQLSGLLCDVKTINVEYGSKLRKIYNNAFDTCDKLTTFDFSNATQLVSIGTAAFSSCKKADKFIFPSSLSELGNWCFNNCQAIRNEQNMNLSATKVTKIPVGAFKSCSGLVSLPFGDNISWIGACAFQTSSSLLVEANISDNVEYIGYSCFEGCTKLSTVKFGTNSSLGYIGDRAFYGCSLGGFEVPSKVSYLGTASLANNPTLATLTVASGNLNYNANDNAIYDKNDVLIAGCSQTETIKDATTKINDYAFSGAKLGYLTTINMQETKISEIGKHAFEFVTTPSSTGITILLPNTLTKIDDYAFSISEIVDINLGSLSKLEYIGEGIFYGATKLPEVIVPDSVTKIPSKSFYGCDVLKKVTIPNTVQEIGEDAFGFSLKINSVDLSSFTTVPSWSEGQNIFADIRNYIVEFKINNPSLEAAWKKLLCGETVPTQWTFKSN